MSINDTRINEAIRVPEVRVVGENGDNLGLFSFRGYDGNDYTTSRATIAVKATEDWEAGKNGNQIAFRHTPNGSDSMVTALLIKGHGDVYIPNGNLYVKGTQMNVPDYVFEKDYKLMSLDELKSYIETHKHLPGVTSAKEVGKSGVVNLSGLQMTLLEKVEELTLYTIKQQDALAKKDAEITAMKADIKRLKALEKKVAMMENILTNLALKTPKSSETKVSLNTK